MRSGGGTYKGVFSAMKLSQLRVVPLPSWRCRQSLAARAAAAGRGAIASLRHF